jgi:plastocyanin
MPLLRRPRSRHDAQPRGSAMIGSMLRSFALVVGLVVVAAGCSTPGGASSSWSFGPSLPAGSPGASGAASAAPSASASPAATASASAAASPSAASGQTVELTIATKANDELEFDPDSAKVPSGALVKVTFHNQAATLPHNLTFADPINAATDPVVAPGGTATLEFTAPAPGDYTWMCTIHPTMKGKLEVDAAAD